MKKFITIVIAFALVFGACTTTTFASSSTKYVKVKKATYQKYKKAYNSKKQLEKDYAQLQAEYDALLEQYELTQMELEEANGLNQWTWTSIKSLGITYKDKTWTVPSEYPSQFIINGTTYHVQ